MYAYIEVPFFPVDVCELLLGYVGREYNAGEKFAEVYSKNKVIQCGEESYVLGDFLAKKEDIKDKFEDQEIKDKIEASFSLLERILPLNINIIVSWY